MHWLKHADVRRIAVYAMSVSLTLLISFFSHAQKSVLSDGQWFKLAVTESGIYRIDAGLLSEMGVDIAVVRPAGIRIYGNGGAMIPQSNKSGYVNALMENAIWVSGEEDGKFDKGDAVYFYAEGPHVTQYDASKAGLRHQINHYSDSSFYFITFAESNGLRIKSDAGLSVAATKTVSQFDDYWYHETESSNTLKSGREWWGEYLAGSTSGFTVDVTLPGVVASSDFKLRTSSIGAAQVPTRFIWQVNGTTVGEEPIGTVGSGTYDVKALQTGNTYTLKNAPVSGVFKINVSYNKNGQSSAEAYLDYIGLQVKRELRNYEGQQIYHFLPQVTDTVTYQFLGSSEGFRLWNITNPLMPEAIVQRDGAGAFRWTARGARSIQKYISFAPGDALPPVSWQTVGNQNIASTSTPDLLIITPPAWEREANRLAGFRNARDGLDVRVVTTHQIYNEYASGRPDITAIRDFVKELYHKTPGKLKYLLLFGDATYDYRNLLQNQSPGQRAGWMPVYESRESLNPVYTYSSDDYFGFMDANEGDWNENTAGDHTVDIGIGRLPVKSLEEAKIVVDKLIRHESSVGMWKNTVRFVADDGDGNIHQRHADQLADLIQDRMFSVRSFIDEVPQTTTDAGQKAPAINRAIRSAIDQGTLILNYTGHGGVSGWAEEQVLTLSDMLSARGMDNLPLLITATCDFGRYDDPGVVSGAELMVLSPKGAAIGAISTTRPVYSSTNFALNKAFYEALLNAKSGQRLGDFFLQTKNNALAGSLNRNFTLLADPSMILTPGKRSIRWAALPDTLRALQKVTLGGEIFDPATNMVDVSFNGTARVVIYDKPIEFRTLGNEGNPETYTEFRSKLFDGSVSVKEGRFQSTLQMPKDIDYRAGTGRASIYAVRGDSISDASAQLAVIVGGSAPQQTDTIPPKLAGYLNTPAFRDGDTVEPSSSLVLRMSDESGINISRAGIGHDITMTLNDTLTVVLNDYYVADLNNYQSGAIIYPLENLPAGKYIVRAKVWDAYTNFSEIAFGFLVGPAKGIQLNAFKVYPNPFQKDLTFELGHDRANEDVELIFNILLINGQLLGTYKKLYYNSEPVIREMWDLAQWVKAIPVGESLVYHLRIRSLKDNSTDQKAGKLIRSP
ncbi:type IX secretion system sortase PorU [Dyadobacter sp. CY261]|uniref:type IX secretion system sortase PorU n=1 Tax=Dyadobacter sp. CY261 TaxID=2907203 RepID=UPI001F3EB09E|nr:type IX secretion system sortase PorU [Dyadobacter sp. CY261]MCF0072154.1 type IX secretion system sortase PorU [Dyadobacter sp. CY261]